MMKLILIKQGKCEGFHCCDRPNNRIWPMWPWNWTNGLEKIGYFFHAPSSFVCHFIAISAFHLDLQSGNTQIGSKLTLFVSHYHKIWHMILKNNRAHLLWLFYFNASFRSHQWIQLWVTVRKRSNRVKFDDCLPTVTLKFQEWPWKTIGHFFYTHPSFVHHFIAICVFRFEFQSGNAQLWSKSTIFCLLWPWNFMDDLGKQ